MESGNALHSPAIPIASLTYLRALLPMYTRQEYPLPVAGAVIGHSLGALAWALYDHLSRPRPRVVRLE